MACLFLAHKPPPDIRSDVECLGNRLVAANDLDGHRMDAGRLHLTLAAAVLPHLSLQEAMWRAQMVAASMRGAPLPVTLHLSGTLRNGRRKPFTLRGEGMVELKSFRHCLSDRMRACGFAVGAGFTPHITLIWANRAVGDRPIAPLSWMMEDFELVLSSGGDHIRLGRWPLTW